MPNLNYTPSQVIDKKWWRSEAMDLFFFCKVILASGGPEKFRDFGTLQRKMCDFVNIATNPSRKKLLSVFRGTFKTTVLLGFVLYLICWYAVKKEAIGIVYNTATKDNADLFMKEVRHYLLNCDLLHVVFPEIPNTEAGFASFTKKLVQVGHVEFMPASMEEQQVSRHHKIIINDDLENDKNVRTITGIKDLFSSWRFQKSLLMRIKIHLELDVGTPYDHRALMWYLIKKNKTYDKLTIGCFEEDGITPTWPEIYSKELLEERREEAGKKIFSSQYELKPIMEEEALCLEEWIEERWTRLPENYWRTMVIDPGGWEAGKAEPTGITIVDTDEAGTWFVVYAEQLWLMPLELINTIKKLMEDYKPDDTRIEKEKYAVTIADQFEPRFPHLNISFVEHKRRKKPVRIWRLRSWLQSKRIKLGEGQTNLEDQLLTYPQCDFDDILDSLAYHIDIRVIPKKVDDRWQPEVEESFAKEMEELTRMDEMETTYNDSIY